MNKLIKVCAIGGIMYGMMEFGYTLGKADMLGILKALNVLPTDAIDIFSEDNHKKLKFIASVAKLKADHLKSKIES